ncbi:MAG: leucine-rich repeat protein [Paludibacter sp.]|nr:leucine-rich repeat protein [Paludibacter sp.]
MKKITLFLMALCFCAFINKANAWDISAPDGVSNVTATLSGSSPNYTLTISGTGAMVSYARPQDFPWFSFNANIKTLILSNGITYISARSFYGCSGLTSITIPNSIGSIGDYAFFGCNGLTTVNFNAINCLVMGSVLYPAFQNCTNIITINIGNNVTRIPAQAFCNCTSFTSVIIPNSVTSIGLYAFCNCIGLTSVTIPNSVTSIADDAFYNCSGLTSITVKAITPPVLGNNVFYNVHQYIGVHIPCSSYYLYSNNAQWSYFYNFIQDMFTVTVQSNDNTMGNASVTNQPTCSYAEIQAYPNSGYYFQKWSDNVVSNPRTLYITRDTTITAIFGTEPPIPTISLIGSAFYYPGTTTPTNWDTDINLQYISTDANGVSLYSISDITFLANGEFVLRLNQNWETVWRYDNNNCIGASGNIYGVDGYNFQVIANNTYSAVEFRINWATNEWTLTFVGGTKVNETFFENIKIYPNPAKDELKIESGDLKINSVEITDLTGRSVMVVGGGTAINVSALPTGIYLVKINTDRGVVTKKVVKE